MNNITLETKFGTFTGNSTNISNNYLGIKYAHAERFQRPVLIDTYGNYDATHFGDCCPQQRTFINEDPNFMYYREFRENMSFTYSEDCLSLNIFAPKNADKCPVLIYIHGGSFAKGSSAERPFDGSHFAEKGIICVTLNYRINIFGSYMGKNMMLYDMNAAINWVYEHIEAFGGNKENITLSGQSAGAMSVQCLILNPEVKKMIKRAIMISGGGATKGLYSAKNSYLSKKFYKAVDKKLASKNLNPETCSSEELFMAYFEVNKKKPFTGMVNAVFPTYDDDLVQKKFFKNAFKENQIDCVITITKDDLAPKGILVKNRKKYHLKAKNQTYMINFDRNLPGNEKGEDPYNKGAFHSSDLWYFFGNLDQHVWRKFDNHDKEISDEIMNRTVAFCSTGNPNCENLPAINTNEIYILN